MLQNKQGSSNFSFGRSCKRILRSFSVFARCPYSKEEIKNAIIKTVGANKIDECYIRPILFFGYGNMGLKNLDKCEISFAVAVWPWPSYLGEKLISAKIVNTIRTHPKS